MRKFLQTHKRFYIVGGTLMFLSFLFNIFGVGPSSAWFTGFEKYSEALALQTVQCADQGTYHGNLINPPQDITYPITVYPVGDDKGCFVYPSQFGLQGFVYAAIPHITHNARAQEIILFGIKFILVVLMVVMLLLFVLFVHTEFGLGTASIVMALLILSPWPAGYARNLYWVSFLFFAPFIASLYLYPMIRGSRRMLSIFLAVAGGLLFIKFLNGYEYFTTIIISTFVPMVYWELRISDRFDRIVAIWLRRGALLAVVALAAFGLSFGLTVLSLRDDYGSGRQAYAAIQQRGALRSDAAASYGFSIVNFHNTQPQLYNLINQYIPLQQLSDGKGSPLAYIMLLLINYAAQPVMTLPVTLTGFLPMILQSFLLWSCLAIWAIRWIAKRKLVKRHVVNALSMSLLLGFIGILSWFIMARGFVFQHVHITPIIYYIPFTLFTYSVVAIVVSNYAHRLWVRITSTGSRKV